MGRHSLSSYHHILWKTLVCYLIPIVITVSYHVLIDQKTSLNTLSLGIFLSLCGTLAMYWMISKYFIKDALIVENPSSSTSLKHIEDNTKAFEEAIKEAQNDNQILRENIHDLSISLEKQANDYHFKFKENQNLSKNFEDLKESFEEYRYEASQQLEQQQVLIRQLQTTVADQKSHIEKRQQQIGQLDSKVNDLTYEIKTLLKLAEAPEINLNPSQTLFVNRPRVEDLPRIVNEKQISSVEDASHLLKRCLDISQKITGSYHFSSHIAASLDSAADNYTLDLRRLCDILRSEGKAIIVLYSPKDNQLLFVNNHIKMITGWNPEKFMQNFSDIVIDLNVWKQGINGLAIRQEVQTKLTLKTRFGQDLIMNVHFGLIPTGIFKQHAIAIMWH